MWLQRGKQFAETSTRARQTIAELGAGFVHHDAVVMVHGFSRVALALLHQVANNVSTLHLPAASCCFAAVLLIVVAWLLLFAVVLVVTAVIGVGYFSWSGSFCLSFWAKIKQSCSACLNHVCIAADAA